MKISGMYHILQSNRPEVFSPVGSFSGVSLSQHARLTEIWQGLVHKRRWEEALSVARATTSSMNEARFLVRNFIASEQKKGSLLLSWRDRFCIACL